MPCLRALMRTAISPKAPGEVVAMVLPRKASNDVMPYWPNSTSELLSTPAPT